MDFEISNLPDDYLILSLGADEMAIKPLKLYGREIADAHRAKKSSG